MTEATRTAVTRRQRREFRAVEVVAVHRLSPHLVSVAFAGAFDGFDVDGPTRHIKMLFPGDGAHAVALPEVAGDGVRWPDGEPRPAMRTYTPRRFDQRTGILEVQFVIHGEGPASAWADRATPGDGLAVAGPGGRLSLALAAGPWLIAGDESALPAIGTLLDALPAGATVQVYVEIEDPADRIDLGGTGTGQVHWLFRSGMAHPGALLHDAIDDAVNATSPLDISTNDLSVWVACEAAAVRRVRRTVLDSARVDPNRLVTRGYWRSGESNHPDHDFGDD